MSETHPFREVFREWCDIVIQIVGKAPVQSSSYDETYELLADSDGMPLGEYEPTGQRIHTVVSNRPFVVLNKETGRIIHVGYRTLKELRDVLDLAEKTLQKNDRPMEKFNGRIPWIMELHASRVKRARVERVRKLIRRARDLADAKIPAQKPCPFPVWKMLRQGDTPQALFLATVADLGFPKGERWGKVQTRIRAFGVLCEKAGVQSLCEQLKMDSDTSDSFYVPNEGLLQSEYGYHIFLYENGVLCRAQFRHPHADMPYPAESPNDIVFHPDMKLLFVARS